jgi:VWFA-related protein
MRSKKAAIALLLATSMGLPAVGLGQEAAPAPQVPVFSERVEVRVLDLDVDVTDSKGQPVTDLKREDFTVRIAGNPMPIDYFSRVADGTIHSPDLATASPDQVLAAYKRGDEVIVPRNFLIYIDLGFISPGIRNRSLNALSDFVTRLGPSDATRIVLFDRSPKVLQDWTTSKESAISVLSRIEREHPGMSRLQTERQTIALIDSTPRRRRGAYVQQYAQQVAMEIQTMLTSMQNELVTLTPLAGKKSFMFVSGGFEYQPGFVMAQYASGSIAAPSLNYVDIRQVPQRIGELVRNSNSDEITFYTIDATGLTAEGVGPANDDPLSSRPGIGFQARQDRQNGLQELAYDTGGRALLNTNDFQRGLSGVYEAVSTYYTVGVNLSNLPLGKYEKVEVTVNRPGVTVRARRGFEARPEQMLVEQRARATMETDLAYTAIPAKIQAAPPTPDKKLYRLPITITVPANSLTFVPSGDKATAKAAFYIGSIDDKGNSSPMTRQETTFELASDKTSAETPLTYAADLQTKKGNYRIVVNVRDVATGKMGTAKANVRVE